VREQVPPPTKFTVPPETAQTKTLFEVTEVIPESPEVTVIVGVKLPPFEAEEGMFVIDTVGVAWFTVKPPLTLAWAAADKSVSPA
jgi:hypothetical protein